MNIDWKKFLGGLVILLFLIFVCQEFSKAQNGKIFPLEVSFLDVGQGDAILINYLGKYQVLIDGGPNGKQLLSELGRAMPWEDKRIEIIILTHPDADHLSGLIDILDNYEVDLFLDNGQSAKTQIYQELLSKIENKKIERQSIFEGSFFSIGEHLDFFVFNPDEVGKSDAERNESSVVLKMNFGENSFLFTGDAEMKTEADMAEDEEDLRSDWLKIGHHGSKSATSEEFLKVVGPKYAIFSVGEGNRYGHPNEEVLKKVADGGVEILRTDKNGTIVVQCRKPQEKCHLE